jgi:methylenetetrahydrofolate reductase (NADPH)
MPLIRTRQRKVSENQPHFFDPPGPRFVFPSANGIPKTDSKLGFPDISGILLSVIRFIPEIHAEARNAGRPAISIEFFPPKTEEGVRRLLDETVPALMAVSPAYCSVTYGAGGGTRDTTIGIVDGIQKRFGLTAMMHLTCVGSTRAHLEAVLNEAADRGVKNILALRGDPPQGQAVWTKTEGGFEFSYELVRMIRERGGFAIGTAGFPEGHIAQKAGKFADWAFLAQKVSAGADFVVTQLFFDNDDYFRFRDHLAGLGVTVPIIPGLLPVLARAQTKRFTEMCGARLPDPFLRRLDELGDDDAAVTDFGVDYCARQIEGLLKGGAPGVHFYTLNKAASTVRVVRALGLAA